MLGEERTAGIDDERFRVFCITDLADVGRAVGVVELSVEDVVEGRSEDADVGSQLVCGDVAGGDVAGSCGNGPLEERRGGDRGGQEGKCDGGSSDENLHCGL